MAVSPFTGTNWESVGVAPDIDVPSYKAFDVAYLEAVRKLRARTTDEDVLRELNWILPVLEANVNPVVVDEDVLKSYAGKYGPVTILYDYAALMMQQANRRPFALLPMSQTEFRYPEMNEWRILFHPDADGKTDSITVYDDSGSRYGFARNEDKTKGEDNET